MRVIRGKTELTGNSCPISFAYAGAGKCRTVVSIDPSNGLRHEYDITHLGLLASGFKPRKYLGGVPAKLTWGTEIVEAVDDPQCPNKRPYLYRTNSCESRLKTPSLKEIKRVIRYLNKDEILEMDTALYGMFGDKELATNASNLKSSIPLQCKNGVWKKSHPKCKDVGITSSMDMD